MAVFDHKFPYTDFHELNLDYLLEHYQELVDSINEINTWISQHKIDYNEAIARLTAVENEINTFEAQVNAEFARLKTQLQNELTTSINQMNAEIDSKLRNLQNQVDIALNDINGKFDVLQTQINTEITSFKNYVSREIIQIRNEMRANNTLVFEYVENRIQELIDSLPEIITIDVYNPYRGYITNIQTAINDIYSLASDGLTAIQYDTLGLTAQEYDDLNLTALEYDTEGYLRLFKDPRWYMISPFNGSYVLVQDVVTQLAQFHKEGIKASEYDALLLTAEDYDNRNLTAYEYDWFGGELLTA